MANTTYSHAKAISLVSYLPTYRSESEQYDWPWQSISTIKNTSNATEQVFSTAGLPMAQSRGQGEPAFFSDMAELAATTFTVAKYSVGTTFSDELISDNRNLPDLMKEAGAACGRSHAAAVDLVVAQIFNRAFNSSYTMFDGTEMCGTHTLNSGDSLDNDLGPTSLSYTSLWTSINYFETSMKNQAGLYEVDTPKVLVCHPSLLGTARKLLESGGEPDTASTNNANTVQKYGLRIVTSRYFSSSTAWFLLGEKFKRDLCFFWNWKKRSKQWPDNENGGIKIKAEQRFAVGARDFIHIVGNPGA